MRFAEGIRRAIRFSAPEDCPLTSFSRSHSLTVRKTASCHRGVQLSFITFKTTLSTHWEQSIRFASAAKLIFIGLSPLAGQRFLNTSPITLTFPVSDITATLHSTG